MPRRLVLMSATGLVATMLAGGFLLADGSQGFGLLMLVCGPLGVTLNALLVRRNMQRQRDRIAPGVLTGRVLEEPTGVPIAADEPRWTGGGNVSTDVGRMNAGSPLAVLGLTGGNLELRFRPRRLAALFGAGPCRWQPLDVVEICPVRGRMLRLTRGVAITAADRPTAYFWTAHPEPVLAALAQQGFPVAWAERAVKLLG